MLWSYMGCLVDADVVVRWTMMGGMCRTPHFCRSSLGSLWRCMGGLRTWPRYFGTERLHKVATRANFKLRLHERDSLARCIFLHMFPGVSLERGWLAQRSLLPQRKFRKSRSRSCGLLLPQYQPRRAHGKPSRPNVPSHHDQIPYISPTTHALGAA